MALGAAKLLHAKDHAGLPRGKLSFQYLTSDRSELFHDLELDMHWLVRVGALG